MLIASYSATFNSDIILSATGACVYSLLGLIIRRFFLTLGLPSFYLPLGGLLVYGCVATTSPTAFPVVFPNLLLIDLTTYCLGFYFFDLNRLQRVLFVCVGLICLFVYSRFYIVPRQYQEAVKAVDVPVRTLTLYDLDGRIYPIQDSQNRVVITDFWFIGCVPCMEKIPYMEELTVSYKDDPRVTFVTVALGKYNTLSQIRQFVKKHKFKIKVLYDKDNKAADSLGFAGAPFEVILNNNSVRHSMAGFNKDIGLIYYDETRKRINALLD